MNQVEKKHFFKGKLVLITGAGSGIGEATAYAFAQLKCRLILLDINIKELERTRHRAEALGAKLVEVACVDVSSIEDMQRVSQEINARFGALDILVNNAGVTIGGRFLDTTADDWRWLFNINVMGVVHGCQCFLPAMVKAGNGHVVNIASLAGFYAAPESSIYSASKHAVIGLTESLRAEMQDYDIGVSAVCPGVVNTNMISHATIKGGSAQDKQQLQDFYSQKGHHPDDVATAIIDAVYYNKALQPVNTEAWAVYTAKRISPLMLRQLAKTRLAKWFGLNLPT